jgi:hypothetical protein
VRGAEDPAPTRRRDHEDVGGSSAPGLGIGARTLGALKGEAVGLGHRSVRLYTNRSLDEAKAMYGARGYVEIARYNDDPYADHWFEKRLS